MNLDKCNEIKDNLISKINNCDLLDKIKEQEVRKNAAIVGTAGLVGILGGIIAGRLSRPKFVIDESTNQGKLAKRMYEEHNRKLESVKRSGKFKSKLAYGCGVVCGGACGYYVGKTLYNNSQEDADFDLD